MIPYGKQNISEEDIAAVVQVLRSDYVTQGPCVPQFEQALATYCDTTHCVATNSATSALHIALMSLDVGQGDFVWTSPISFVASSNSALYCGAMVDFVDISSKDMNMDMEVLAAKLKVAETEGRLPKVVIPVHLSGRSCDMKSLQVLRERYGFYVVEDASHAVGADYCDGKVGSCTYSDITVFSFHPVKIITTGEGGAALTNNNELMRKMSMLRSHGITRVPDFMTANDGRWYYEQHYLGFNYRMTEFQGALGLSQLKRLDKFVARRRELSQRYRNLLPDCDLELPPVDTAENRSSWHLYVIRIAHGGEVERRALFDKLISEGIGVNVHYIPIYRQPYYEKFKFKMEDFPASEDYYARAISIPMFYDLTDAQQDSIVEILNKPVGFQTIF